MNKIYLVKGESGDYASDLSNWNVNAFLNEQNAQNYCDVLNKKAKEVNELSKASLKTPKIYTQARTEAIAELRKLDPIGQISSYDTIRYEVEVISVSEKK